MINIQWKKFEQKSIVTFISKYIKIKGDMKISGQPLKHPTCAQHQQLGFLWVYEKAVVTAPACNFF